MTATTNETRKPGPSVSCVFICHDGAGRILLAQRSAGARDEHGTWDTGAGGIELGETFEEAVAREVREEYGADAEDITLLGVRNMIRHDPFSHWIGLVFAVRIDPVAARIMEPHKFDAIGWFTPDALPTPLHSQAPESLALFLATAP